MEILIGSFGRPRLGAAGGRGYTDAVMWRLALLTCGPQLEVALARETGAVASVVRLAGGSPRSTLLLAAVDLLAEDAGVRAEEIRQVVVSRGPGSFTGIRSGLATAEGLAAATGVEVIAYGSLLAQAARCEGGGEVWAAQPGRRGEVYAQKFRLAEECPPVKAGPVEVLPLTTLSSRGPWVAAELLDLGGARRRATARTGAEALLALVEMGVPAEPPAPFYVEGPPVPGREG